MSTGMGYVYILHGGGYRKIGKSIDPEARLSVIMPALPFKVEREFLFMCRLGSEGEVERLLHQRFRERRENGEWFSLNEDDLKWLSNNPLPLPVVASHAACFCQACSAEFVDDYLEVQLCGLS